MQVWESWLQQQVSTLRDQSLLRSLRELDPVRCTAAMEPSGKEIQFPADCGDRGSWQRAAVEVELRDEIYQQWLNEGRLHEKGEDSGGVNVSDRDKGAGEAGTEGASKDMSQGGDELKTCKQDGMKVAGSGKKRRLLLFSGNDYLGLSCHPQVRAAAAQEALQYGMGPRASALVCGYTREHAQLERELARLKGTQDCLLCPSGFAANLAVLSSMAPIALTSTTSPTPSPSPSLSSALSPSISDGFLDVFSDALNHASIIDGVRLLQRATASAPSSSSTSYSASQSRPTVRLQVYRHNDMQHLDQLLAASSATRKLVVTDSLFSMDGDFAPLSSLVDLKAKHGFLLLLDEAHTTLVCGPLGAGAAHLLSLQEHVDLYVGTLSKAFGCQGGFVACSSAWKGLIASRGRAFVFSTALPLPVVAAARASLSVSSSQPHLRDQLWSNVHRFSARLLASLPASLLATELPSGPPFFSPICPIVLGCPRRALEASRRLLIEGFHVPAIRPPTVPQGSSRLRVALSAAHSFEDVDALANALCRILHSLLPPAVVESRNSRRMQAVSGQSDEKKGIDVKSRL